MIIDVSTDINPSTDYFDKGNAILDIRTSTNFWRTSQLLEVDLISADGDFLRKLKLTSEKESDEYDILLELTSALESVECVITFNGTGFDIPHLTKKYRAYRRDCPLENIRHRDLRTEFRRFSSLLPIKTHKLADYYSLVSKEDPETQDADKTLAVLKILGLEKFLNGQFELDQISADKNFVTFHLSSYIPCAVFYEDDVFRIEGNDNSVSVRARICGGDLRMYHTDFHNYMYLPYEGYAVHKSLASYIASSRKIPAVKENCYVCVPFDNQFTDHPEKIKKYIASVVKYCVS